MVHAAIRLVPPGAVMKVNYDNTLNSFDLWPGHMSPTWFKCSPCTMYRNAQSEGMYVWCWGFPLLVFSVLHVRFANWTSLEQLQQAILSNVLPYLMRWCWLGGPVVGWYNRQPSGQLLFDHAFTAKMALLLVSVWLGNFDLLVYQTKKKDYSAKVSSPALLYQKITLLLNK